MTWPTHALFGISSLWVLALLPPESIGFDFGTLAAIATFGSLLPDLDASESKIKHLKFPGSSFKPFLVPAEIVHRTDQHRGVLHSLSGLGMMALMTIPFWQWGGWAPLAALLLGYGSHLLADAATKSGILLLYPRKRRFYLLPQGWRISTGSLAEEALMAPLAVSAMFLLLTRIAA